MCVQLRMGMADSDSDSEYIQLSKRRELLRSEPEGPAGHPTIQIVAYIRVYIRVDGDS